MNARIAIDPQICHGRPCIKGTRVMVSIILDNLAAGQSNEQIMQSYPGIRTEDINAAVSFAADLAREQMLPTKSSSGK